MRSPVGTLRLLSAGLLSAGLLLVGAVTACAGASSSAPSGAAASTPSEVRSVAPSEVRSVAPSGVPSVAPSEVRNSKPSAVEVTTSAASSTGRAPAAPASPQISAAVRAFYTSYATAPSSPDTRRFLTEAAATAVYAPGGDVDRVWCAQNEPRSVIVGAPVVGDGSATVDVTTRWADGTSTAPIVVTVALPDIRISHIRCPAA